jgi:cytochrome P450
MTTAQVPEVPQAGGPRGLRDSLRAARALLTEPCSALDALSSQYGRTFDVKLGPQRLVIVGDAALVGQVVPAAENFRWRTAFRNLTIITGPTSLLVSDGEDHRRRRRQAQPAFALRRLEGWKPLVVRETDALVERLPAGADVDLQPLVRQLVMRIITQALFGEHLASRADAIGEALAPGLAYATQPALRQLPHPFPAGRRHAARRARAATDRLIDAEIVRRRTLPVGDGNDILDAVLAEQAASPDGSSPDGSSPDDQEIRDLVVSLIGAGTDTTSTGIAWTLVRALTTPGVWQRLRAEADAVLDDPSRPDLLARLPYAEAVVRESLRLHPPGPISPRFAVRPFSVGPYDVRPRTFVVWSAYLMGRDPAYWDEPTVFRPERFLDGSGLAVDRDAVTNLAYLPFGAGVRKCIGFALAQMEMQLVVSRLAQRLDLEPAFTQIPAPEGMVTSRPRGGVPAMTHMAARSA